MRRKLQRKKTSFLIKVTFTRAHLVLLTAAAEAETVSHHLLMKRFSRRSTHPLTSCLNCLSLIARLTSGRLLLSLE